MEISISEYPEIDITKLGPRQWYLPSQITIRVNDTVRWTNNDTEAHTVTSGIGAGKWYWNECSPLYIPKFRASDDWN
jgi:plastocyanin